VAHFVPLLRVIIRHEEHGDNLYKEDKIQVKVENDHTPRRMGRKSGAYRHVEEHYQFVDEEEEAVGCGHVPVEGNQGEVAFEHSAVSFQVDVCCFVSVD